MSTIIRKATPEDVPAIYQLIVELAEYEKALHEVINTPKQLLKDGFGESPLFGAIIAEVKGEVVGMSLYYYRYSTWKGKRLYLEDLIIKEAFRGYGLGKRLWQVLDWNEPSIEFYKKFGAKLDGEWINCHFDL